MSIRPFRLFDLHNLVKILCMETITCLVTIYPTTHRTCSNALTTFSLGYLNGTPSGRTNQDLMNAASQLFAALPMIGGKVGAVNLWRKSLDETLAFGWEAFLSLRTTSPTEGTPSTVSLLVDLLRGNSSAEKYQASLSWE